MRYPSILFVICLLLAGCRQDSSEIPSIPPVEYTTPTPAAPALVYPKATGFVNDFAGILSTEEKAQLESTLQKFQSDLKIDFAIAAVKTTGEQSAFDYSLAMAKEWKVGSENGGILLLFAVDDRKWHIQIDKKLEQHMTNDEVKKIGDVIVPDFKAGKYGAGIKKCVDKMIGELVKKKVAGG